MREYILAVRGMLEEGSAQYKGKNTRLSWHKIPLAHSHRRGRPQDT